MQVVTALTQLVLHVFHAHTFSAVFFFVLIEEAGIPIPVPGDSLVMLAGAAPHKTLFYDATVLVLSSVAVFAGSSILYAISRRGGRSLLDRYGRYVHLNERRLARMEHWFARRGRVAIVFGRLIPGLRIPTTIMAGLSGVSYSTYAPTAAIAAIIWSLIYFWLGVVIQHELGIITGVAVGVLDYASDSVIWVWLLVALLSVGGTWHMSRRVRRARQVRMFALLNLATSISPTTEPLTGAESRPR